MRVSAGSLTADAGEVALVLDRTCFYPSRAARSVTPHDRHGDGAFDVATTQKFGDAVLHFGTVTDGRSMPSASQIEVDAQRELTRKNHTATHLLHWALPRRAGRACQGNTARWSIGPPALRLRPQRSADRRGDGRRSSGWSTQGLRRPGGQDSRFCDRGGEEAAGRAGRSSREVRRRGPRRVGRRRLSMEFCGGTHLSRTGQIGFFKLVGEEAVAQGASATGRGDRPPRPSSGPAASKASVRRAAARAVNPAPGPAPGPHRRPAGGD